MKDTRVLMSFPSQIHVSDTIIFLIKMRQTSTQRNEVFGLNSLTVWGQMASGDWTLTQLITTMVHLIQNILKYQLPVSWFQIGKGGRQGCILSSCLFNLYAQYIMRNTGLEEAQAGIKIAGRNINNLRYADDTTHMAESEEELKSLLMKVKEESEKVGLNLSIQKMK